MTRAELIAARSALRRADTQMAQARIIFLSAGYAHGARVLNRMMGEVADLIAQIDKALDAMKNP